MWYGWDGWGWCAVLVNVLAVTVLLGIIIAGVALAVRVRDGGRSGPPPPGFGGFAHTGRATEAYGARGATADDDFYRRLM